MNQHGTSAQHRTPGTTDVPCGVLLSTATFRTSPTDYLKLTAGRMATGLSVALALPIAACAVAAVFDIRWIFVALILVFLVFPLIVGYIYFSKLLTPAAQQALTPKHLEFLTDGSIAIIHESADEENQPLPPTRIGPTQPKTVKISGRHAIIDSPALSYPLRIPLECLPSVDALAIIEKICS